jgi:hypothetical protein
MKRRLLVLTVVVTGLLGGGSAAQAIGGNTTSAGGYWGCVGTHVIDFGFCAKNPLPERLPIPATPSAPSLPS